MSDPAAQTATTQANQTRAAIRRTTAASQAAAVASPHFRFPTRARENSGTSSEPPALPVSKPDELLYLIDPTSEARILRLDQPHAGPPAVHLRSELLEQFVGWTEITTLEPALEPLPSDKPPHQPLAPTPEPSNQGNADLPAVTAVSRATFSQASSFSSQPIPFGRGIRTVASASPAVSTAAARPEPPAPSNVKDDRAPASREQANPAPGTQKPSPKARGNSVAPAEHDAAPAARERKEKAPQTAPQPAGTASRDLLESIPLIPEPAWPLVSELLLGAGWPFTSRLAEGLERTLAGVTRRAIVCGVQRSVGTTTLCLTLARWAAANRRRVLIVDADATSGGATRLFGRSPVRTWLPVASREDFLRNCVVRTSRSGIALAGLTPVRSRQLWPPFLLDRLGELLDAAVDLFDLVLIDAGPVHQVVAELSSSARLSPCAMAVSAGETAEEPLLQTCRQQLSELGIDRILSARNFSARPLQQLAG